MRVIRSTLGPREKDTAACSAEGYFDPLASADRRWTNDFSLSGL